MLACIQANNDFRRLIHHCGSTILNIVTTKQLKWPLPLFKGNARRERVFSSHFFFSLFDATLQVYNHSFHIFQDILISIPNGFNSQRIQITVSFIVILHTFLMTHSIDFYSQQQFGTIKIQDIISDGFLP